MDVQVLCVDASACEGKLWLWLLPHLVNWECCLGVMLALEMNSQGHDPPVLGVGDSVLRRP